MSKYTAEQVDARIDSFHGHALTVGERAELFCMAREYAALLREREAAMQGQGGELVHATEYAERLARHLWRNHYAKDAPQWEPLSGDLRGLLSQIDNMCAGITNSQPPQHVRSVSEEDVDGALAAYEASTGPTGISPLRTPMRAALEHFAAIAQEKQS